MCALGHILEAAGLATVLIGLIPQHVERMRPPRALLVPFELGRPMGTPGDPAFQHRVLNVLLALVARTDAPVIEWFTEPAATGTVNDAPWACPVSFPPLPTDDGAALTAILAEIDLLEPWHDRAMLTRGSTAVGASGVDIRSSARYLAGFLEASWPEPLPALSTADGFKLAAEDLKLYYLEAAAAQPGGSSRVMGDWFWDGTQGGALLKRLAGELVHTPDPLLDTYVRHTLVPETRQTRH